MDSEDFRSSGTKFDWEKIIDNNKITIALVFTGLILVGFGAFLYKQGEFGGSDEVQVLENTEKDEELIVVEVAGSVEKPGVYRLENGSRVEDLLIAADGISVNADRDWVEKTINRAAKLKDGQKLYIPDINEQNDVLSANSSGGEQTASQSQGSGLGGLININTATLKELDTLPGIGPVYGQNIIEHRPYSTIEELVERDVLKQSTLEKIREMISVF